MIYQRKKDLLIALFLLLTIFIAGYLYKDSFNAYFFQDDWFTLKISQAGSFREFINFFIPRNDVIYYRPLGMQVPFFLLQNIFGINSFPFHLLTFATHAINVILFFALVRLLIKRKIIALFASFFYATSTVHYIPFFWNSTYAFVLGPTAFFLSFILFLKAGNEGKFRYYWFSLLVFILGLLVNEIVVSLPVVIFLYLLLLKKKRSLEPILPYLFVSIVIFIIRLAFYIPSPGSAYQLIIGREIITNLKTYLFWSFSLSEIIIEQMVKLFVFNPIFTKDFYNYTAVSMITFFVNVLVFFIIPLIIIIQTRKEYRRLLIFSLAWFVVGLLPVLFFRHHKFAYYLPISLSGLLLVSAYNLNILLKTVQSRINYFSPIIVFLVLMNWMVISIVTIEFNSKTHWAPRRARKSQELLNKAKIEYTNQLNILPLSIYVKPSSENKLALNDQDAFKIIFKNKEVTTIYGFPKEGISL